MAGEKLSSLHARLARLGGPDGGAPEASVSNLGWRATVNAASDATTGNSDVPSGPSVVAGRLTAGGRAARPSDAGSGPLPQRLHLSTESMATEADDGSGSRAAANGANVSKQPESALLPGQNPEVVSDQLSASMTRTQNSRAVRVSGSGLRPSVSGMRASGSGAAPSAPKPAAPWGAGSGLQPRPSRHKSVTSGTPPEAGLAAAGTTPPTAPAGGVAQDARDRSWRAGVDRGDFAGRERVWPLAQTWGRTTGEEYSTGTRRHSRPR
jgi:hypothetical protein